MEWYTAVLKTLTFVPLEQLLSSEKLDAIIVSTLVNIRYYTGFTGSNGLLLVTLSGATLFTDPRIPTDQTVGIADQIVANRARIDSLVADRLTTLLPVLLTAAEISGDSAEARRRPA